MSASTARVAEPEPTKRCDALRLCGEDEAVLRLLLSVLAAVAALASFAIAAVAGRAAVGTFYDFLAPPEGIAALSHGGVFDLLVLLVFVPVNRMLAGWSRRTGGPAALFHRLHSWTLGGIALLALLPLFIDINVYLIVSVELLMFAIQLLLLTFMLTAFVWRTDRGEREA